MKKKIVKRYTADFETEYLSAEQVKAGAKTYVWAWALCDCDTYDIQLGTSTRSFIEKIDKLGTCEIYFHNLRYDIQFLLSFLLQHKWKQVQSNKNMQEKEFSSLVSIQGIAYSLELKTSTGTVLILDSLKKIPMKVEKIAKDLKLDVVKGEIDYKKHREEDGQLDPVDEDYIRRDVLIPAKALNEIFFKKGFTRRTIGADCLEYFRKIQPKIDKLFPKLSQKEREFIQEAYNGGVVLVNRKKAGKLLKKNGKDYDCNSMYPFSLHSSSKYKLPIGHGEYYEGAYEYDPRKPFYIQHILVSFELKKGKFPFIHSSQSGLYKDNEFIVDTEGEMIDLTLCCYDMDLFFENYEVNNIFLVNGYKYEAGRGFFDKYIDEFYEMKRTAKENGNLVEYITAKLFLNNLGGKFAQSENGSNQIFYEEDGIVKSQSVKTKKDTLYMPIAIAMTSIARNYLFKMIDANSKHFIYCDTDCIKIDGDVVIPEGVLIDDFKLGAWKVESEWNEAIFIRAKTYAEHTSKGWQITGAGMTDEVKKNIIEAMNQDPLSFKAGKKFNGKLQQKKVKGGVILNETTFKIKK